MTETMTVLGILAGWIILQAIILPRMGVDT